MPDIKHEARELLKHQKELSEITVWQLKQLLLNAAEGPITNPATRASGNTSAIFKASNRRSRAASNFAMPPPKRISTIRRRIKPLMSWLKGQNKGRQIGWD
jgi:hypothetical protein